jgi:hypothetical protein
VVMESQTGKLLTVVQPGLGDQERI